MYGKLFEQMYDGTLGTKGPWQALVTFQQFIILADKAGDVDMTPEAISRRTTIPLKIITAGIAALEEPDPDSRSPALEGRRLVRLSTERAWGWRIVNYVHYRLLRSQEERREYMRLYQQRRRNDVNTGKQVNTELAKLTKAVSSKQYAKAYTKDKDKVAPLALPGWLDKEKWSSYVKSRKAKSREPAALKAALEKLEGFRAAGHDPNAIVADSLANGWQGLFEPKSNGSHSGPAWWTSDATILAKAQELGIHPRGGETYQQLKGRIEIALQES